MLCWEETSPQYAPRPTQSQSTQPQAGTTAASYLPSQDQAPALLPIIETSVGDLKTKATIFFDGGSNTSDITHKSARKLEDRKLGKATLDITSMGEADAQYHTCMYEMPLVSNYRATNSEGNFIWNGSHYRTHLSARLLCD